MFGATGIGMATVKHFENGKKRPRYSVDRWDQVSRPSEVQLVFTMS